MSIYEMAVRGKESENDIAIRMELLKGTSKLVSTFPQGAVYITYFEARTGALSPFAVSGLCNPIILSH